MDIGARRAGRMAWSQTVITLVIMGALLASSIAPAGARPGRHGLAKAERQAITISSLSAVADPSLGLVVRVTFAGDVERYLGQGNLRNAVLALVVAQLSGAKPAGGVIDAGGGASRLRFLAIARRGQRLTARPVTLSVFGSERIRAVGAARQSWVVRHRNEVTFYLAGSAPLLPATLELKVFARSQLITSALAGGSSTRLAQAWHEILVRRATSSASVAAGATKPSCGQLMALAKQLGVTLSAGLAAELRAQRQMERTLRMSLRQFDRVVKAIGGGRQPTKRELSDDLARVTAMVARLRGEIAAGGRLIGRVGSLVTTCSQPPPPPSPPPPPPPPPVSVVQTDSAISQQLAPQPGLSFSAAPPQGLPVVDVSDQIQYQRFAGLGANLTDSAAWLIYDELSPADRTTLMQQLFGPTGIHLSFLRTAMGASGAMTVSAPYTYDDVPQGQSDPTLSQFTIAHDLSYTIPTLQQALSVNPGLQVLASPWSPPAWMKTNDALNNMNAQGKLLSSAYQSLANYFVKYLQAYAGQGIPVAAITPQNEPSSGQFGTAYPGLTLPEANEAQFIAQDLQPALSAAGLHTKIYGNDLSWDQAAYASALTSGPAASALSGIAWHCYFGSPTVMSQLQQVVPGLDQIVEECSPEIRSFGAPEFLISALRNWASLAAVWAIATDPTGGPIQPGNNCGGCRGLVTIDEQTHTATLLPEYYQLGQISSFVQPGAARIDSPNFVSYGVNGSNILTVTPGLDDVAFLNPDGSKVLIAYDNSAAPISFAVQSDGRYFTYTIPAQAMTTFVWH
jgi:glucosylceramidase